MSSYWGVVSKYSHVAVVVSLSVAIAWASPAAHAPSLALQEGAPAFEMAEDSGSGGLHDGLAGLSENWWAAVEADLTDDGASPAGISPTADWSAEGNQAGAEFGISVATAGDVNGDGYDDVIVGTWQYDGGATDSGRAYIFHGSAEGLNTTADRILEPPSVESYGYFGVVVGTAGDVNGDGYDDVMVGMTNYNHSYGDEGGVFVWYGSVDWVVGTTHDWMARGNATYAHMGWDLGTAGDVNGDGYDDIIVGAYRYDQATVSDAHVWYGSDQGLISGGGLPGNADWSVTSDQTLSAFGTHVGSAGDVNGDGFGDIFVGAPAYDNGETDEGMVFVWYGSDTGLPDGATPSTADWTVESNQANAQLSGRWNSAPQEGSAGTAGDVNGDGYDDFVVGSFLYDNPDTDEGAVFLWYGSAGGLGGDGSVTGADWRAEGDQASAWFSSGAGTAGDVNGDGYDDVLVGACYYDQDDPGDNHGLTAVWMGSADGPGESGTPSNADWAVGSGQIGSNFGWAVATAGDVNGDGLADVIVGARQFDNPELNEGAAFVYHGQMDPIAGLAATSDSPTLLGETTTLTATVTSGALISYTWTFGDGQDATGAAVTHEYAAAGTYTAVVTATNPLGEATASTVVTVQEAPAITSADSTTFVTGVLGSFTVTATGFPTSTIVAGGALPVGVTFTDNGDGTASLAGTPVAGTVGAYPLTITASNGIPPAATQAFTLEVNARVFLPLVVRNVE